MPKGKRFLKEVPEHPKNYNAKDTKQWCRGRQGVEHKPAWVNQAIARKSINAGLSQMEQAIEIVRRDLMRCHTKQSRFCSVCHCRMGWENQRVPLPLLGPVNITIREAGDEWIAHITSFGNVAFDFQVVGGSDRDAASALAREVISRLRTRFGLEAA